MGRAMDGARRHRIDHALKRVSCRYSFVRGRQDRIASADWASSLPARLHRDGLVTLACGAMVPITRPTALAAQLAAALPWM
jgi:pimeloyl-ACP methyl ester carboxylesterase